MKVTVVEGWRGVYGYRVQVAQGGQRFTLDFEGSKDEALWMARMFRTALKNHDKEKSNANAK